MRPYALAFLAGLGTTLAAACGGLRRLAAACGDAPVVEPERDLRLERLGRCKDFSADRSPYIGDLHVYTSLSLDANLQGNRLSVADACRFARGEQVGVQPYDPTGKPMRTLKLSRPLDFVAVTDHAEFLGVVYGCLTPGSAEYDSYPPPPTWPSRLSLPATPGRRSRRRRSSSSLRDIGFVLGED